MAPFTAPGPDDPALESITVRDDHLAAGIRLGYEEACEALYRIYRRPLWELAYSYVRSGAVAEELVQDVFLALWRTCATGDIRESVRAWLFASVRNRALNHLRHERVRMRLSDPTAGRGAAAPPVDEQLEATELAGAVRQAVAALPERRRAAMLLRWQHGLSAAEIGLALGTSPESVRVLLTRARQDLAALLDRFRGRV